jgi:hypothetical protein
MTNYTSEQLARHAYNLIQKRYSSCQDLYTEFRSNINRKIKSLHPTVLTAEELEEKSLKVAESVFSDLHRIPIEIIETKLSDDIKRKSRFQGIELPDYADYFNDFAKEIVKQFMQSRYNSTKKKIRQATTKKKK